MQVLALLSAALLLIILDQSTKALVRHGLGQTQTLRLGLVVLRHRLNRRAFFGSPSNNSLLLILLVAEVVALMAVTLFAPLMGGTLTVVALGIAAGGASSNVIDQVLHRGVVDFIDLGWWPVFNLADLAIVVGATSALVSFGIALVTARFGVA
jgi:signal peptidase II